MVKIIFIFNMSFSKASIKVHLQNVYNIHISYIILQNYVCNNYCMRFMKLNSVMSPILIISVHIYIYIFYYCWLRIIQIITIWFKILLWLPLTSSIIQYFPINDKNWNLLYYCIHSKFYYYSSYFIFNDCILGLWSISYLPLYFPLRP